MLATCPISSWRRLGFRFDMFFFTFLIGIGFDAAIKAKATNGNQHAEESMMAVGYFQME